jgi:hypothetical protein
MPYKPVIFKKEFEDKLKKLRIKTKFVKNIRNQHKGSKLQQRIQYLDRITYWKNFVSAAFFWVNTPEGWKYWVKISYK